MKFSKLLLPTLVAALVSATAIIPVAAQPADTAARDTASADQSVVMDDDRDDDGFDWGLLGLLGLLGLIPRKRQDVVVHRDDANRNGSNRG